MIRSSFWFALVTAAFAAPEAYDSSFVVASCPDGWAGCVVSGRAVSGVPLPGANGAPMRADLRVDWFSLQPTAATNTFAGLSNYMGRVEAPPELPPEPPPEPIADADVGDPPEEVVAPPPVQDGYGEPPPEEPPPAQYDPPPVQYDPPPVQNDPPPPVQHDPPPPVQNDPPPVQDKPPVENDPPPAKDDPPALPDLPPLGDPVATPPPPPPVENETVAAAVTPPPTLTLEDIDCHDVGPWENDAKMGTLDPLVEECLEGELAKASRQTDKARYSRLLIVSADAKDDRSGWARLVSRHLTRIDSSDPDMAYAYSRSLSRKGASKAGEVIRWAEVALENKHVWTGATYASSVDKLLDLRANAAMKIWNSRAKAVSSGGASPEDVERARNNAKTYAREWYEFAKQAGRDSKRRALQLCASAAGTESFCEAG
ncbi:MAG: hypothetical protein ACON5B_05835 [Myxococcota bacterium]